MTRVGIVGAGVAGAATASVVDDAAPEAEVTVFESRSCVGGRTATRRLGDVTYEYGANYLKDADEGVAELVTEEIDDQGLVDVAEPIYVFDADGTVAEGRPVEDRKWTYRDGIDQLPRRLLGETGATVHLDTAITGLRQAGGSDGEEWWLESGPAAPAPGEDGGEEWGPFDAVVLSPPATATARLLRDAAWDDPVRERVVAAVEAVEFRAIYSAVLHYPVEVERPYYALVNPGKDHELGWIAREECKSGHVPEGESVLLVQANHEWSVAYRDADPTTAVDRLAELTADVLDDERLARPDWTDHHLWDQALPETGVDTAPLRTAEDRGLFLVGDWVAGEGRIHAALRNGLDAGERLCTGR